MSRAGSRQILEATSSFHCEIDGQRITVLEGETRVASDDVLAMNYPEHFKAIGMSFPDDEQATDTPGESRGRQTTQKSSTREVADV